MIPSKQGHVFRWGQLMRTADISVKDPKQWQDCMRKKLQASACKRMVVLTKLVRELHLTSDSYSWHFYGLWTVLKANINAGIFYFVEERGTNVQMKLCIGPTIELHWQHEGPRLLVKSHDRLCIRLKDGMTKSLNTPEGHLRNFKWDFILLAFKHESCWLTFHSIQQLPL